MKSFTSILLLFAGNELSVCAAMTEKWMSLSDIQDGRDIDVGVLTTRNAFLKSMTGLNKLDFELRDRGCGNGEHGSSNFVLSVKDGLVRDEFIDSQQKWHKIRYTLEFVSGASSCWSLFGDRQYGRFQQEDRHLMIEDFGLTTFDVIENGLTVGSYNGENRLCNNEKSNFMHRINGVGNNGYLTVEQDRDLSAERAGISAGFSCTDVGQIVRLKDISVAYWMEELLPRPYTTYSNKQCVGTGNDILRNFVGTTAECKAKCDELDCIGFVRVHSAGSGSSEFVGKCYFRGGEMNRPYDYTGDVRDCYIPNTQPQWSKYELLTDTKLTWHEAQAACQETFGADLASVHSMSDYDDAYEVCEQSGGDCWIGLHRDANDESSWQWSDGKTVDFGSDFSGGVFPWADNEPNNWNGIGEECTSLKLQASLEWNDAKCDALQYAVCNAIGLG